MRKNEKGEFGNILLFYPVHALALSVNRGKIRTLENTDSDNCFQEIKKGLQNVANLVDSSEGTIHVSEKQALKALCGAILGALENIHTIPDSSESKKYQAQDN